MLGIAQYANAMLDEKQQLNNIINLVNEADLRDRAENAEERVNVCKNELMNSTQQVNDMEDILTDLIKIADKKTRKGKLKELINKINESK